MICSNILLCRKFVLVFEKKNCFDSRKAQGIHGTPPLPCYRFFVTPSDSVAIIAANAVQSIPYFASGLKGVAR